MSEIFDVEGFVKEALSNADQRFWTDPCSGTGKYHPPEDQGEGCIIRHVIKSIAVVTELERYYDLTKIETDAALAAVPDKLSLTE